MAVTRDFIVTVSAYENDEWTLVPSQIHTTLSERVGYSGYFWIDNVKPYVAPGKVFTGKIQAIKEIRSLLSTTLIDSKSMVDAAKSMGTFRMMGLTIVYSQSNGQDVFTISDNR